VGKSTLLNRIVGSKVAIVSNRPADHPPRPIRGIATGEDWQLVAVDLPGVQRPARRAHPEDAGGGWSTSSRARMPPCSCSTATRGCWGPGDRFIAGAIRKRGDPARRRREQGRHPQPRAHPWRRWRPRPSIDLDGEVFAVSAQTGEGFGDLVGALVALMPEGPFLYPRDERTDLSERVRLAELIREQVLAAHASRDPARGGGRRSTRNGGGVTRGCSRSPRSCGRRTESQKGDPDRRGRAHGARRGHGGAA